MSEDLLRKLRGLATEGANPATANLDGLDALGIVTLMNTEDARVAEAISAILPDIAKVAEMAAASFAAGGRLIYVGAGTSGRLGVLDAAECPPTFGSDPSQVIGVIAGGHESLIRSREGVEDRAERGVADLMALEPGPDDTVVGISASHRTPYTVAALREAEALGCATAFITANARVEVPGRVVLRIVVGPEVIAGSTRLKAGSAQKMVLNMISSAAMVLSGKVYGNRMVDLQALSEKLTVRGRGVIIDLTGLDYSAAAELLEAAGGHVKTALLMHLGACDRDEAHRRLERAAGHLRVALTDADGAPEEPPQA